METMRNRVQLIGHLGKKPETKTTENGKKLVKFSLATSDSYKNNEGKSVTETQWHNLTVWGKLADVAEKYLDKGSQVVISGKLLNRSYESKSGEKKYTTEIVVNDLVMVGKKSS
ncbi:MAG: single-stranded DNA-binding protein [Bacteroidetes bacterium]|nr:single-stranded DNA-binding protein [Bacteroidota bacterium]